MERPGFLHSTRREFLTTAAFALSAALTGRDVRAGGDEERAAPPKSVLIVGAGMSGLAAARTLSIASVPVTVLDARDRIGGRIVTDRSLGFAVDLGAAWIHGTGGNPLTALARRVRAKTSRTRYENGDLHDNAGNLLTRMDRQAIVANFEDLLERALVLKGGLAQDISLETAFGRVLANVRLTATELERLRWAQWDVIVGELAGDLSEIGLRAYDEEDELPGGDVLFPGGYDALPQFLARGLDVRLGQSVRRIDYTDNSVTVTTDKETFTAEAAIVTLPLGVLKSGAVTFAPALPAAKTDALGRLRMGLLNKVVLRFPNAAWPQRKEFFEHIASTPGAFPNFLNLFKHSRQPALVALNAGSFADSLEALNDTDTVAATLEVLRKLFGNDLPAPTGSLVTRWRKDPLSLGSYSFVATGGTMADLDTLAEPVGPSLRFAGEHTHRRFPATVHGAYLSGVREAQALLPDDE